jgi:hypothetical protein
MSNANVSIKFDHLPRLAGQSNYVLRAGAWHLAFKLVKWWNAIDGTTEKPTGEPDDLKESKTPENSQSTWAHVDVQSHAGIANTVEDHLLSTVIAAKSAAEAWKSFKARFDRDTANTTITQLKNLLSFYPKQPRRSLLPPYRVPQPMESTTYSVHIYNEQ